MGFADNLRRLCVLKGMGHSDLARRVGVSKSSMSRILSGAQEPRLRLAAELAEALGVTVDYLMAESVEGEPNVQLVALTEDELTILKIVRRLGPDVAIDRLLHVPPAAEPLPGSEPPEGGGPEPGQAKPADESGSGLRRDSFKKA